MANKTLSEKIFEQARLNGLEPHSIVNNCTLILKNGSTIYGTSKKDLLKTLTK